MTDKKEIAKALIEAQANMGFAEKNATNPHFRKSYADLASVMKACMPHLNNAGIAVVQTTGTDESGPYLETSLIHAESGQEISARTSLIIQRNDMQGYGSAITYARRYGLMGLAGISPDDDDGAAACAGPATGEVRQAKRADTFDFVKESERISSLIALCATIEDLKGLWQSEREIIAKIGNADKAAGEMLIAEKDARKAAIQQQPNTEPPF